MNDYKFHEDWDISTIFATSDVERTETEIKMFFKDIIDQMIPLEHQDKIKYYCRYHKSSRMYHIAWLYPGKRLFLGKTQEAVK